MKRDRFRYEAAVLKYNPDLATVRFRMEKEWSWKRRKGIKACAILLCCCAQALLVDIEKFIV